MQRASVRGEQSLIPLAILAGAFLLLYLLWSTLLIFILAGFLAFLLDPLVRLLAKQMPRLYAIVLVYLLLTMILTTVVGSLAPAVNRQFDELVAHTPEYVQRVRDIAGDIQHRFGRVPSEWRDLTDRALSGLQEIALRLTREALPALFSVVTSIAGLVFVPLLTFFMLLSSAGYMRMVIAVTPPMHRQTVENLVHCMSAAVWAFLRGEFILMAVVGTAVGVGLYAIGMPYGAVFGIIAGLLEVIPSFGPVLTTVLAASVGFAINPVLGLKCIVVTSGVQLLENVFLVPVVMARAVGLDPITIAFSVFFGGSTAGIVGAVIAIPLALIAKIVILYFYVDESYLPGRERTLCPAPRRARRPAYGKPTGTAGCGRRR